MIKTNVLSRPKFFPFANYRETSRADTSKIVTQNYVVTLPCNIESVLATTKFKIVPRTLPPVARQEKPTGEQDEPYPTQKLSKQFI